MATSAMDLNRGAAAPHEFVAGAGRPGSRSLRLVPLVRTTNEDASKIKEGDGSAVPIHHFIGKQATIYMVGLHVNIERL